MSFGFNHPQGMRCKKCNGSMPNGMFYLQKGPNMIGLGQNSQGDGPYCLRCYDQIRNPPEQDTRTRFENLISSDKKTGLDKAVRKVDEPRRKRFISDKTIIR